MPSVSDCAHTLGRSFQWKYILVLSFILLTLHVLLKGDASVLGVPPQGVDSSKQDAPSTQSPPIYDPDDYPPVMEPKPGGASVTRVPYDSAGDEHVAVCISVKDQADDLVEFFVHHYHHMGIRRFYVMDDGSDPPLSSFDYPGIPRSSLTFTFQERETRDSYMQMVFYTWCIQRYRDRHTWLAFIDGDEFIETPGPEGLSEVLRSFEDDETVGALGVNWRMHTSSGLLTRPESARKAFTTCIYDDNEHGGEGSDNNHIKTILKTKYAGPSVNPHKFQTAPNTNTVGEDGKPITTIAWRKPITRKRIGLHHYAVKSRAEYEAKIHRGNGMTDPKGEWFWKHVEEELEHVNCTEMAHYDP